MKINTKEDIINYFQSGYKKSLLIGVENEKFLLEKDTSKRANYEQIKNILNYLKKFGWEEILEDINIIGLNKDGQSITLEPGNQIELAEHYVIIYTRFVLNLTIFKNNWTRLVKNLI